MSPPSHERKPTSESSQTERVRVGQIVGAFGLRGQVKVQPLTDFFERFEKGSTLFLRGEPVLIEDSRIHKGRPLIKLKGVKDATAAEGLKWEYLEAEGRPELEEDQFLTEDLLDLEVYTEDGQLLGTVDEVLNNPAHDILVVGELMIPVVKEFVLDVDLDEEKITVRLIPGMLPEPT
ncbi:MAG TPA: ribosome maturation factor RimM [Fimbriimonas sp.]|nr:ribosome maturation factor RimM [Fimbriimonas sp.]